MKKIILLFTLILTVSGGLSAKNVVKVTQYAGSEYREIQISSMFEVTLMKSKDTRVEIEIDAAYENNLTHSLKNGVLKIGMKGIKDNDNKIIQRVTVYTPHLEKLALSGMAELVKADNFSGEIITLTVDGMASIKGLQVNCEKLNIHAGGMGKISAASKAEVIDVYSGGMAKVNLDAGRGEMAALKAEGNASLTIKGNFEHADAASLGMAKISAKGFKVKNWKIRSDSMAKNNGNPRVIS